MKLLILLATFSIAIATAQNPPLVTTPTPTTTLPPLPESTPWRQQLRQAIEGATDRFQGNLVTVLNGLANTTVEAGQNVTVALATLTRAVVTNTFDLASVVAYTPRLVLLDLPQQFVEVLQLIRRNEIRLVPTDVNGAIDAILAMTRQAEESGITKRIFEPIARFLPNMMGGVQVFVERILGVAVGTLGGGSGGV